VIDGERCLLALGVVKVCRAFDVASPEIIPPRQKPVHVGANAGVNENDPVFRSDNVSTVALSDIHEVDFQRSLGAKVVAFEPAHIAAAADLFPVAIRLSQPAQPVPQQQMIFCPASSGSRPEDNTGFGHKVVSASIERHGGFSKVKEIGRSHSVAVKCPRSPSVAGVDAPR